MLARLSIIEESGDKFVRMAHLAVVGSHAVNGVAELHSELVKTQLFRDFYGLDPSRFFNVTNGVTPRRFIALSNSELPHLIDERIGRGWSRNGQILGINGCFASRRCVFLWIACPAVRAAPFGRIPDFWLYAARPGTAWQRDA